MEEIQSKEQFTEVINSDSPVLVDCFAVWCGPCKMLAPMLNNIKDYKTYKVDVEKFPDIAQEYGVTSVPTVMLFKAGEVKHTINGVQPLSVYTDKLASM